MPVFQYSGKNLSGGAVSGTIDAASMGQANEMLKRQQIVVTSLDVQKSLIERMNEIELFAQAITTKEVVIFTRQFAVMIDAGLPLVQCLEILANNQENKEFKRILMDIKGTVEGGSTFAESLKRHPHVFDQLFVNLIAAGEVGGILDTILNRLSGFMEKSEKLKGEVKGALTYPIAVIVIALIIVTGLLVFIVPIFEDMFAGFGSALPAPTQIVVNMSDALAAHGGKMLGAAVAVFFGLKQYYKTTKGQYVMDAVFLKLPVFGDLLKKSAVARFTRTLGTMMSSGVPILEALDIVAKTAGNKVIEEALMKAKDALSEGKTLAEPLQETQVFPGMVTQMIAVGESTGAMDAMLNKIADFYEDEVDAAVKSLTSLIEPLLMAFLGVVVGGLVIALYLPIFSLAGAAG